jgi:hypothetical protein
MREKVRKIRAKGADGEEWVISIYENEFTARTMDRGAVVGGPVSMMVNMLTAQGIDKIALAKVDGL